MSKVQDFISATHENSGRSRGYLVTVPIQNKGHSHWAPGSPRTSSASESFQALPPFAGVESFSEQIRPVFANYHRFLGTTPSRRVVDRKVEELAGYYKDLKRLGFEVVDVTSFGLKHAKALLGLWQTKGCASNTVYCRWSFLRSWSRVLGKHGMLPALRELQPEYMSGAGPEPRSRALTLHQVQARSDYLATKADKTVYLVDRLVREIDITREQALEIELDAVQQVVVSDATILRVGTGSQRKNVQHIRLHMPLMTELRDFMLQRNRKALGWSDLDIDAALQKYTLRLAYVTRKLFPKEKGGQA